MISKSNKRPPFKNALTPKPPADKPPAADEGQLPPVPGKDIEIVPSFPGEKPTIDEAGIELLAKDITENWKITVTGILTTGKLCAEAVSKLDPHRRRELIEKLPFNGSMFSKLVTIGKSKVLRDPEVQKHVSAHWSLMYPIAIANLTPEEAHKAISEKAFSGTRKDLEKWLSKNSSSRKNRKRRNRKPVDDADHDDLLHQLRAAFTGSPELMAIWNECPLAVRKRFAQALPKLT